MRWWPGCEAQTTTRVSFAQGAPTARAGPPGRRTAYFLILWRLILTLWRLILTLWRLKKRCLLVTAAV
jgi:hypothetical protein